MNVRAERRPTQPQGKGPGWCKFCDQKVTDARGRQTRGTAHPACRADWRQANAPVAVREFVFRRDNNTCLDCRRRFPESHLEADHDDELADGGRNDPTNYVTRCHKCHDLKTEERRMARTATKTTTRRPATGTMPEPPHMGGVVRIIGASSLVLAGATIVSTVFAGHRLVAPAILAATVVGVLALLVYAARWVHWRRSCEAQRVYERLCKVTKDPNAARRRYFKVHRWSWLTPTDVTLRYGAAFNDHGPGAFDALTEAFARAIGEQPARVTARAGKRGGRVRLAVGGARAQESAREERDARVEEPPPVIESAEPPADVEPVTVRVRDALEGVLGEGCEASIDAWWPDGAPRAGTIAYPSRATRLAREARADLPTVMGDAFTPRSEHGLWQFSWEPGADRFRFADIPDALAPVVPLPPIDPDVDLRAGLVLGVTEHGDVWRQPILEDHVLIAGTTGAGKGSVLWGIIRGLTPFIEDGRCLLYVSDPKGGMEFTQVKPLAHRFALRDDTGRMLKEAVADMQDQAARLAAAGARKLETPTQENPLRVVIVDELANFAGDKEVTALMATLLQQGRAVGVVVIGALQDSRVKAIDNRDLFKSATAMRLRQRSQADMVLGPGMRAAGAVCDRIPKTLQGVGYVVTEDHPDPVRVRAAFVPDSEIARLVGQSAPEHGEPVGRGQQLSLAPSGALGRKVYTDEPVPVAEPAREVVKTLATANTPAAKVGKPVAMRELTGGEHVLLPDDPDAVRVVAAGPDPEEEDQDDPTLIEVTYVYDGETQQKVGSFDRDDLARYV